MRITGGRVYGFSGSGLRDYRSRVYGFSGLGILDNGLGLLEDLGVGFKVWGACAPQALPIAFIL